MRRTITSSVLSALVVVTLLWGGCISCPQFFMFPTAAKSCCNKDGKCERPTKTAPVKECKRMPFEPQASGMAHSGLVAAIVEEAPVMPVPVGPSMAVYRDPATVEPSPPDLNVLHATFLI